MNSPYLECRRDKQFLNGTRNYFFEVFCGRVEAANMDKHKCIRAQKSATHQHTIGTSSFYSPDRADRLHDDENPEMKDELLAHSNGDRIRLGQVVPAQRSKMPAESNC